jgi:hypothetical protein
MSNNIPFIHALIHYHILHVPRVKTFSIGVDLGFINSVYP